MSFADEALSFVRTRGVGELGHLLKRTLGPAGGVLDDMGPAGSRLHFGMRSVDDDTASGAARYFSETLPIDDWDRIAPEKRTLAFRLLNKKLDDFEASSAMADDEISGMVNSMRTTFSRANEENIAARDYFGNSTMVRDPFSGELRPYEGITGDYVPLFVKASKRNAILDPINYTQEEMERRLYNVKLGELGLGKGAMLSPDEESVIRNSVSDGIDDFLRTGQKNTVISDDNIVKVLSPAKENFDQLYDHVKGMRGPSRNQDPIMTIFGSDDPTSRTQGIRMLREFLLNDARAARRFGSIESSRAFSLPDDWYENDPLRVVPIYIMRQQRRLAEMRHFGQNNEVVLDKANGLLGKIADDGDREFAKTIFERAMGIEPYSKSIKVNNLLDWAYASQITKLGTAQISQMGQIMNSIMETDLSSTWKALTNLSKSRDIAIKSGASLSRVMDIVREGLADPLSNTAPRRFTESFLKWTGFNKADLLARHIGAGAGYAHGQDLLEKIAKNPIDTKSINELRRLIPGARRDPEVFTKFIDKVAQFRQTGNPTPEAIENFFSDELLSIARTASLNANFRQSILDVPGWASHPLGKLVMIFRGFAYRQTNFMLKRGIEDYRDGNPRTLLALGVAAGALGPMISALKSIPRGSYAEWKNEQGVAENLREGDIKGAAKKAAENIATVGGMGIFDGMVKALFRGELGLMEFIAGPLFTDIARTLGAGGDIAAGATGYGTAQQLSAGLNKAGRLVTSHIPIVGGGVGQAVRSSLEPVVRLPSGQVVTERMRPIGSESPPVEFLGMTLPSPKVLFGLEESAVTRRKKAMESIKKAIGSGDMEELRKAIVEATNNNVVITNASLKRLVRQHLEEVASQQR